jgi:IS5 family transposase
VELEAVPLLTDEFERHGEMKEIFLDRGYLGSPRIAELREQGVIIHCKPWPSRNRGRFTKQQFDLRLTEGRVVCPAGVTAPISTSLIAKFPASSCRTCRLRTQCTTAQHNGRSISIHPQESLMIELRRETKSQDGRTALRRRTTVEHSLARLGRIQGHRARYKGTRKNTLDVRRCAAVDNLQTLARMREAA